MIHLGISLQDYKIIKAISLFLAKHNKEQLESLKLQLGRDEFETQYQQEPTASEAGYFESIYFKEIASYEISATNDYIFVDNAMSLNDVADNRAVVTIGIGNYNESVRYIVKDCRFGIWSEEETIKNIIETMLNYKKANVYIESDGGGLTLNRLLQREIIIINERLKRQDKEIINNNINIYTPSRKISKVEKIKALRSYYNTGALVFLYGASGTEQIKKGTFKF